MPNYTGFSFNIVYYIIFPVKVKWYKVSIGCNCKFTVNNTFEILLLKNIYKQKVIDRDLRTETPDILYHSTLVMLMGINICTEIDHVYEKCTQ